MTVQGSCIKTVGPDKSATKREPNVNLRNDGTLLSRFHSSARRLSGNQETDKRQARKKH